MSYSANVAVRAISGADYVDPLYGFLKCVSDFSLDRIRVRAQERQLEQSERKQYLRVPLMFKNTKTNINDASPSPESPPSQSEFPIPSNSPRWTSVPIIPNFASCPPPRACTLVIPPLFLRSYSEIPPQNDPFGSIPKSHSSQINPISSFIHLRHPTFRTKSQKAAPHKEKILSPNCFQILRVFYS